MACSNQEVRRAIAEARERGITVAIVTGRILDDLRRVAGDLRFVDVVVAENGAVVAFPEGGPPVALAASPPQLLIDNLRKRGVSIEVGHCIIEAEARFASEFLGAIRQLELPYVLVFNRSRLMALPSGINKASGFREALRTFASHRTTRLRSATLRTITTFSVCANWVWLWPGGARLSSRRQMRF